VQERIRRLEDRGIIEGYHAKVNLEQLGLPLMGVIRVANVLDFDSKQKVIDIFQNLPEVTACYQLTGEDEFVIHIHAQSIAHMSKIKMNFAPYTRLITSIVIKQPIDGRVISLETFPYLSEESE